MRNPSRDPEEATPSRASARVAAEAVVASYIHDISERHRAAESTEAVSQPPS